MVVAVANILVLGATGYTGRLIVRYLLSHPRRGEFSFAVGGRSQEKLDQLRDEEKLGSDVPEVVVGGSLYDMRGVVPKFQVVINAIAHYWETGEAVVEACLVANVHYLDLTGESPWLLYMLKEKYRRLLGQEQKSISDSIVLHSCGFGSIPSDVCAWTSVQALKKHLGPSTHVASSTTSMDLKTFVSRGTLMSGLAMFSGAPRSLLMESSQPFSLSPVTGKRSPRMKLSYSLSPYSKIIGSYFLLGVTNIAWVNRTWGLLESQDTNGVESLRYGPNFIYSEFQVAGNIVGAVLTSFMSLVIVFSLLFIPPVRWIIGILCNKDSMNPDYEELKSGGLVATNITLSEGPNPIAARTVFKTLKGDVGYMGSSVMISECALLLLLKPRHETVIDHYNTRILTAMSAFGDSLVESLKESGYFEITVDILDKEE